MNIYNFWEHVIRLNWQVKLFLSDDCLEQYKGALWSSKLYNYLDIINNRDILVIIFNLIYLHCWTCLWHLFHNTLSTLAKTLRFVWHASNPKCNSTSVSVWGGRESYILQLFLFYFIFWRSRYWWGMWGQGPSPSKKDVVQAAAWVVTRISC